jgi:CheY-like chemotaxis protein
MGLETILLLHNDAGIRQVIRSVLQQFGYCVLEAGTDMQALRFVLQPQLTIDLLLTDNGAASATYLAEHRPDMRVLCMSTDSNELACCGDSNKSCFAIQKPLKPHTLAHRIREVLDEPPKDYVGSNRPLRRELRDLDPEHRFFRMHGIETETAQYFGAGFYSGPGVMTGRIVIPIRNDEGELISYAGRSVDGSDPNYKFWPEFNKSRILFNHKPAACLVTGFSLSVIVVQGFFACMKVHQAGFSSVVSLMGPSLSETQKQILTDNFYLIVLMLNGPESINRNASRLMEESFVRVISDPSGRPPDSLSASEIGRLICGIAESDQRTFDDANTASGRERRFRE